MKKLTAILLIAAMILSLSACGLTPGGEKESDVIYLDEPTDENVKKMEPIKNVDGNDEDDGIAPADEPGILDDGTDEGVGDDVGEGEGEGESEPVSAGTPINIYFSDDTGVKFMSYGTEVKKLDAASVVAAMRSIGVLDSGVKVVSFSATQDGGKNVLKLDLSAPFSAQMKDFGTFAGYMLMGSVVNTFLEAFDGDSIIVTAANMNISGYSGKLTKFGANPNSPDAEETEETEKTESNTETGKKTVSDSNPIAATARSLEGSTFENGATGPKTFDNSGFVYYCFKANGISIPRRTSDMYAAGTAVEKDELQKGDVIFYDLDGTGKPTYVAIYLGGGEAITESVGSNAAKVIKLSTNYYAERYFGARRYS